LLDHVTLRVHDLAASKVFYAAVLSPLGYAVIAEYPEAIGLGVKGKPELWLTPDPAAAPQHVAFAAPTRAAVDAFHAAGLAAGARDNGAPGLRAHYHPNYYGAFIDDPSGHHMEAVIHTPPAAAVRSPKAKAKAKAKPRPKVTAKAAKRPAARKTGRRR
jgi:catechol 2,3-dioxygenase-like lactoylglutathione lyase family enzyme